ncbi:clathrin interactor EPSIN 1 isoform X1 [Ziziphus jujuba]|uniref:Clathrin interactor EPSIN 1 isoform X1 n=1 Tax=Ziziphus jujuba TaxID=326968 RepID=A0A6P4AAF4_ZIZJJ|nr:clathrin interactor EPSIN 1 isoform X1 [Ziziphus jujuba]
MDFMKVIDQTVREIKREVNLKVLKVPEIEQKVLDATDNEPWGPHGSALAEIAQATKKFTECQMVMNVLWTRLGETGKDWRYVYKALAVIEYLVAHGSERAIDDIIEHTFQISSLSSFEYVEPSGKDMGLNVRKKAETIVALLNNKDKIQEVRNKAAANRDKYIGLSSTGITYKSGSSGLSSYSSGSYQSNSRYGGLGGSRDGDSFRDSYRDRDRYDDEKTERDTYVKSRRGSTGENHGSNLKDTTTRYGSRKDQDNMSSTASKSSSKSNDFDKYGSIPTQSSSVPSNYYEDDFDDFDPRGTSSSKSAGSSKQVDLFGESLIGDLMDAPTSVPAENPAMDSSQPEEVDLFADATFVSAPVQVEAKASSQNKNEADLFASEPVISHTSPTVDLFATSDPVVQPEIKSTNAAPTNINLLDPFAAVPLNNFDDSDPFGAFTSHSNSASTEPSKISVSDGSQNGNLGGNVSSESKTAVRKDSFQVKSGIWSDSLSRGLIDLNISAPKKVNLADVGVVGGLSDGLDEREKGPQASYLMGRAMGSGTGLGRSGFTSSQATGGDQFDDFFSTLNGQPYQYGGFQK